MSGMFFSSFLFISTHILLDLISVGSAEAYIGWGGKLIASCVRNIHTKNYQNLMIGFKVTVKNVGDVSFETQCSLPAATGSTGIFLHEVACSSISVCSLAIDCLIRCQQLHRLRRTPLRRRRKRSVVSACLRSLLRRKRNNVRPSFVVCAGRCCLNLLHSWLCRMYAICCMRRWCLTLLVFMLQVAQSVGLSLPRWCGLWSLLYDRNCSGAQPSVRRPHPALDRSSSGLQCPRQKQQEIWAKLTRRAKAYSISSSVVIVSKIAYHFDSAHQDHNTHRP